MTTITEQGKPISGNRPVILIVDDTPDNLTLMSGLLREHYRVKVANSGAKALQLVSDQVPDLILLDIMMPDLDGYAVLRQLKAAASSRQVPVIFLTAKSEIEDERLGLELGAVDYITKPISPPIVLARVHTHLQLKAAADFLRDKNAYLEAEVARRTRDVQALQDVTILAMASLAETRDNETGHHIRRTQHYVRVLARHLQKQEKYASMLSDEVIAMLFKSAPLHDIGKVGIPDRILLKPAKLTDEEFAIMKTHTTLGCLAIEHAEQELGMSVEFLRYAKEIAQSHQEKWDGSGYPDSLAGDAIPLSARLMALADVYDALISVRVYKPAMPHEQARQIIIAGRGSHFDPDVVDAFVAEEAQFRQIAAQWADDLAA
ncbi:two-component system response regulator [Permianibacter sp. IMCC34836]|uniref:response regulator n=1 Tax=Permianibacter fluminis TaxID=2738515 RepID=UPI001553E328|nr:two-component system response regulator [Permianibacter fluminis]NQD36717.1 two-component system response regulator [Permianibacter fluminis]